MKLKHKRFQTQCLKIRELIVTQGIRKNEKLNCFLQKMYFHIEYQKKKILDTKEINGYVLPLCLPLDGEFGKMLNKVVI